MLIGAGADIVVGSHAHRLQGVGFQGDKLVAYGLSNFVFKGPVGRVPQDRRPDGHRHRPADRRLRVEAGHAPEQPAGAR